MGHAQVAAAEARAEACALDDAAAARAAEEQDREEAYYCQGDPENFDFVAEGVASPSLEEEVDDVDTVHKHKAKRSPAEAEVDDVRTGEVKRPR